MSNAMLKSEPDFIKFDKYLKWLAEKVPAMSPAELDKHKATYKKGVSRVNQLSMSHGDEYSPPEVDEVFGIGEKNAMKIRWVDLKIDGYNEIGLWHGRTHKTEQGLFVFNLQWLNEFIGDNIQAEDARFKLKLYMDFDCEPLD